MSDDFLFFLFCRAVFLTEIILNSIVLAIFFMERQNIAITHYYIISLSSCDLLKSVIAIIGTFYADFGSVIAWLNLCMCSFSNLVLTAVDRYRAITKPLQYKQNATKRFAESKNLKHYREKELIFCI